MSSRFAPLHYSLQRMLKIARARRTSTSFSLLRPWCSLFTGEHWNSTSWVFLYPHTLLASKSPYRPLSVPLEPLFHSLLPYPLLLQGVLAEPNLGRQYFHFLGARSAIRPLHFPLPTWQVISNYPRPAYVLDNFTFSVWPRQIRLIPLQTSRNPYINLFHSQVLLLKSHISVSRHPILRYLQKRSYLLLYGRSILLLSLLLAEYLYFHRIRREIHKILSRRNHP